MDDRSVQVYEGAPPPLAVSDMKAQVDLIQHMMKAVMRENEHYGVIPGTSGKPSLLKPGAEKLIMTFRLVPDIETEVVEMPREHREYRVIVRLSSNGIFLGTGVGSCCTMEGKYRFRKADILCPECGQPTIIKGKEDFGGGWLCYAKKGGCGKKWTDANAPFAGMLNSRVEHDNPADYYNTCLKMAKKRALVDACLTVTAASDIFTQDVEDMPEVLPGAASPPPTQAKKPVTQPKARPEPFPQAPPETLTVRGVIEDVKVAEGTTKDGKPYKKWGVVIGGVSYGTFSESLGDMAAAEFGREVMISYTQDGKFQTLAEIVPVAKPDVEIV